jgi:hypothetical protein
MHDNPSWACDEIGDALFEAWDCEGGPGRWDVEEEACARVEYVNMILARISNVAIIHK